MRAHTPGIPRWLDDDEQRTWRALLAVQSRLPAALSRDLQRHSDLSLQDFDVLVQLTEHPQGRLRVSALASELTWERSRLSHHVARMERRGLVARVECGDDGRGAFIEVTAAGRTAIADAAPAHVEEVRRLVFDALSPDEVRVLGELQAKILARIDSSNE